MTASSIDDYLARVTPEQAAALQHLRETIRRAAPAAEECISYGLPSFRLAGKLLASFGAAARHCAFYPGSVIAAYADDLRSYRVGRGTVRFTPDRPIAPDLVEELVRARIARLTSREPRAPRRRQR